MKRKIESIGLIIIIALLGGMTTSLIFLGTNPIINNYYYEENYYGNNETELEHFTYPLEIINYEVIPLEYFFIRNFTLTESNIIIIRYNWSGNDKTEPLFFLVADICMDVFYIDTYEYAYTYESGYDIYWNIPFERNWYIIIRSYITANITIYFEII